MTRADELRKQGEVELDGVTYQLLTYWEVRTTGYYSGKDALVSTHMSEALANLKMYEEMTRPLISKNRKGRVLTQAEFWVAGPKYRLEPIYEEPQWMR